MRPSDDRIILALMQRHALPEIVARLLQLRQVGLDEVERYLTPRLRDLMPDPACLRDMDKAVARLATAVESGEAIAVFGDYDVDGATSSAVLYHYLAALGAPPRLYIPDRQKEGYGPNIAAFTQLRAEGHRLIITVDCGTMAHEALAHAKADGIDVLVLDHHQTGGGLPECVALVNPRRADDESGLDYLAAVGVVFFVVVGLNRELRQRGFFKTREEPDLAQWLDLVALGTVCDVVPLEGVNRVFVQQGAANIRNGGIMELARVAGANAPIGTYEMGFQIGPRVNAGGRVGQSDLGVRVMTDADPEARIGLAARLNDFNKERQTIEAQVLGEASIMAETKMEGLNTPPPFVLVEKTGWHVGVVGIVAGRLKDKYHRPSFVLADDGAGTLKGSVRSISGADVGRIIATAMDMGLVQSGGGHAMAAGVTLSRAQLPAFEDYLHKALSHIGDTPRPLWLDATLTPKSATRALYDQLQTIGPFGAGNPEPCFVLPDVRIVKADNVGVGHVRCILSGVDGGRLKAMAFASLSEDVRQLLLRRTTRLHIAGTLRADNWNGRCDVQLLIRDAASP